MRCRKAQSLMLDSLYGELPLRKQKALERHLAACAECSKEFSNQGATVSTFRSLEFEKPPTALSEIVHDMALRELEQEALFAKKKSFPYWKPALASVAATVLVVVAFYYYQPQARLEKQSSESELSFQPVSVGEADKLLPRNQAIEKDKSEPAVQSEIVLPAKGSVAGTGEKLQTKERRMSIAQPQATESAASEGFVGPRPAQPPSPAESPPAVKAEDSSASLESESLGLEKKDLQPGVSTMSLKSAPAAGATAAFEEESRPAHELFLDGNRYFENGEYEKAAEVYERIISTEPGIEEIADVRFRLGQAYQSLKLYERALPEYQTLIENFPRYASIGTAYLASGDCYLALGKRAEAMKSYEVVRDQFPQLKSIADEKLSAAAAPESTSEDKPPVDPQ